MNCRCFATHSPTTPLTSHVIQRRTPRPEDIVIAIKFCGICHSDIHQARDEWGGAIFPMVPGHEIVGVVTATGSAVSRFKVGEKVGVGCFVDSCGECSSCKDGYEQYCEQGFTGTYNALERDGATPTYGGYAESIVVKQHYVLKIPDHLDLAGVAPLLCAGITTYSPMKAFGVSRGQRVGVLGLGGLGHMAVKLARAFGAECTVFSTSQGKRKDAEALGATEFFCTRDVPPSQWKLKPFDFMIDTISADHDIAAYVNLLKRDGTMAVVGAPPNPVSLPLFSLIMKRRRLAGSLIGGIKETQEMLDFCGKHNIVSDVEVIAAREINEAYERVLRSDVKYRFVIDTATL